MTLKEVKTGLWKKIVDSTESTKDAHDIVGKIMRDHPSDQFDRRDGFLINSFPDQIRCLFKGSMMDKTRCENGKCGGVTAVKLEFVKIDLSVPCLGKPERDTSLICNKCKEESVFREISLSNPPPFLFIRSKAKESITPLIMKDYKLIVAVDKRSRVIKYDHLFDSWTKISKREWVDTTVCTNDLFIGIYARLPSSNVRTTEGGSKNHKEASHHRVRSSSGRKRSTKEDRVNWSKKRLDNFKEKRKEEKKERLQQFTPPVLGKSECMEKIEQLKSKKKKLSGNQKRKLKMLKDNLKSLSQ